MTSAPVSTTAPANMRMVAGRSRTPGSATVSSGNSGTRMAATNGPSTSDRQTSSGASPGAGSAIWLARTPDSMVAPTGSRSTNSSIAPRNRRASAKISNSAMT